MLALVAAAAAAPASTRAVVDGVLQPTSRFTDWYQARLPTGACLSAANHHSQLHQDQRVVEATGCMRDGYYVDIGSNDGEVLSNTFALDQQFGWRGLCADPFPHNMANRTCAVEAGVMWNVAGEQVQFEATAGDGGVFGSVVGVDSGREGNIATHAVRNVTFVTRTAREVFAEHSVPSVVDYLSLDVEGAEMHVLRGIDHAAHCFRNVALESNLREPMRSEMREFLEAHAYTYAGSERFDDYYQNDCTRQSGIYPLLMDRVNGWVSNMLHAPAGESEGLV